MKLKEIYNTKLPVISFEVFPPKVKKSDELNAKIQILLDELVELKKYSPAFISVTYGAGGGTRETTFNLVLRIKNDLNIQPMPHFTCVGSGRDEILQYIKKFEENGIDNILALRGDPPKGQENFVKPKDGFGFANELVGFIKSNTNLGIGVAGYPECHPDCCSLEIDIKNLKRKVDSGAEAIITQLFFDNECYYNFFEKTKNAGIDIPIIPGILPITSYNQIDKIVSLSGCAIPENYRNDLEENKGDPDSIKAIGLDFAVKQCKELIEFGVPGIHFYTLNKSFGVNNVLERLEINKNEYSGV